MVSINATRLLADLDKLRSFGATGTGVVRQSLSPIDMASRSWLCDQLIDAGLTATVDGIGTVLGDSPNAGPALLIGSHTDTQPTGGWLDGALGVIYGLEVARALLEQPETRHLPVCVASWIDEESTFYGCLGSKSFCGELDPQTVADHTNAAGETLDQAIRRCAIHGRELHLATNRPWRGYLEAHIEQGPRLEAEHKRIGVVTDIVGSRNIQIEFVGKQNHAGTTPMALRHDAVQAMFEFASAINACFRKEASERTVWTTGQIDVEPNAPSIIPGVARINFQFRDPDNSLLDRLEALTKEHALACATSDLDVHFSENTGQAKGIALDASLQQCLSEAAQIHAPDNWIAMPSGAVHDAQVLANVMPAGMLFVPSIGGVSHAFEEDTARDDIALGCQVLLDATVRALGG